MNWHIGGGQGESGGTKLGEMTQGLGFPLREVSEVTVENTTLRATDDAGDGTVEGDVNATDFTAQTGTTYAEILPNMIVSVIHKSVLYAYAGPTNVQIGVGGNYVTTANDYVAQGTADHALLNNLASPDQHPTSSITGLDAEQAQQDQNLIDHETAPDPHPQYPLTTQALDTWVLAGYGGIIQDAESVLPNLTSGWTTVTGFDRGALSAPRFVVQDYPNNGVRLTRAGIWQVNAKVSLSFDELNAGRKIGLRFFNVTKGTAASSVFVYGVGRNVAFASLIVAGALSDYDPSVLNDLFILQVGGFDDFINVTAIGSSVELIHTSQALGLET